MTTKILLPETSEQIHHIGSRVLSTKNDINTRPTKACSATDSFLLIRSLKLSDKIKCNFFQEAAMSVLLYKCTTWTLT